MPKVRVVWPILFAISSASFLLVAYWHSSWVPDYHEAEPLYWTVGEFGEELVEMEKARAVTPSEIHQLISESRFKRIQRYGVVIPNDPTMFASIRVNKTYAFDVFKNGRTYWNVNEKDSRRLHLGKEMEESKEVQNR